MPYDVKKKRNGKFGIFHKGTEVLAVQKDYGSKAEAERVAWLRMWHEKKG
jgi:hypothetical protein